MESVKKITNIFLFSIHNLHDVHVYFGSILSNCTVKSGYILRTLAFAYCSPDCHRDLRRKGNEVFSKVLEPSIFHLVLEDAFSFHLLYKCQMVVVLPVFDEVKVEEGELQVGLERASYGGTQADV